MPYFEGEEEKGSGTHCMHFYPVNTGICVLFDHYSVNRILDLHNLAIKTEQSWQLNNKEAIRRNMAQAYPYNINLQGYTSLTEMQKVAQCGGSLSGHWSPGTFVQKWGESDRSLLYTNLSKYQVRTFTSRLVQKMNRDFRCLIYGVPMYPTMW